MAPFSLSLKRRRRHPSPWLTRHQARRPSGLLTLHASGLEEVVGLGGLEPPTSRLSSARSNQLSYKPSAKRRWQSASRQSLARPTGRRGSCRALAERQAKGRYGARALIIQEERETKAADPLKVCAMVRMTFFHLVPSVSKGRGSDLRTEVPPSVSIEKHP